MSAIKAILYYSTPELRLLLKFIFSEKATKFCEISTLFLSYVVPVNSKVEISQNFADFSEYMNFTILVYYAQKYRRDAELRSSESITLNVKN
jgi:hypothetical protein